MKSAPGVRLDRLERFSLVRSALAEACASGTNPWAEAQRATVS